MDIVIFGISGDLARNKLLPALISLQQKNQLPKDTRIIGYSRTISTQIKTIPLLFEQKVGDYSNLEDFKKLKASLRSQKRQVFYLALPPSLTREVVSCIHASNLVHQDDPAGFRLILIEKPFGQGYNDAKSLLGLCNEFFRPDQCLKIDHYAGKKELREMEDVDFADITEVTFTLNEKSTVDERGAFYDAVGALRDVGQNHLLLKLTTFFKSGNTREDVYPSLKVEKNNKNYFFGQYDGYQLTKGVNRNSVTDTYFSIPISLDLPHTRHIKLTIRGGKALAESKGSILFKMKSGNEKEIILSSGTDAYEHIFLDAFSGKQSTFLTDKEILAAWKFIEEVEAIKKITPLVKYDKGSSHMI